MEFFSAFAGAFMGTIVGLFLLALIDDKRNGGDDN
jgi:hypothetical protein